MEIFGWIMLIFLAVFGLSILVVFVVPFTVSELKSMEFKIKRAIEDRKIDINKRSEARKNRDEIKRAKDFELANKKLDAKLQKVDKQIEIHQKKLNLAKELKQSTNSKKENLVKLDSLKEKQITKEKIKPKKIKELEEIEQEDEE